MQEVGWATQKMLVPCVQPVKQVSNQQRLATESSLKAGGAGESRTRDTQFRKLLLYPSELQPHIYKSLIEHRLAQGYPLASVDALHRRCTLAVNAFAYRREPKPEPKPCQRFIKRFVWNERFAKHLPSCDACKRVLAYLTARVRD